MVTKTSVEMTQCSEENPCNNGGQSDCIGKQKFLYNTSKFEVVSPNIGSYANAM